VCTAEASSNLARYDGIRYGLRSGAREIGSLYAATRDQGFGAEVKRRIMLGTFALSRGYHEAYYGRAMQARRALRELFDGIFRRADLVLLPTSPTPAFPIGAKTAHPLEMYLADVFTVFANLIGAPAISIPAGFSRTGLPIGVQLVGPDFGEEAIFQAAGAFEEATDYHGRKPAAVGEEGSLAGV
jgi:aspartyl-tRNA(Asn)/glutamyl-tRNA(Gln) amidotransferase subunit A